MGNQAFPLDEKKEKEYPGSENKLDLAKNKLDFGEIELAQNG